MSVPMHQRGAQVDREVEKAWRNGTEGGRGERVGGKGQWVWGKGGGGGGPIEVLAELHLRPTFAEANFQV